MGLRTKSLCQGAKYHCAAWFGPEWEEAQNVERVVLPPDLTLIVWCVCVCVCAGCGWTDGVVVWLCGMGVWRQDLYAQVGDLPEREGGSPTASIWPWLIQRRLVPWDLWCLPLILFTGLFLLWSL